MTTGKIVVRVALGVAALMAGLVLFLVLSTVSSYAFGPDHIAGLTNITIPGEPPVRAWMAAPPGEGPFPAVIMIHEFWGLDAETVGKAEGLAAEGYIVIAPDTFRGSSTRWIPRAIHQVMSHPPAEVSHDLDTVADWLSARPDVLPDRLAVVGFCYGGRAALNFSLHRPAMAATAVFYGSPVTDPAVLTALRGPVLGIFGGADRSIPAPEVEAFERALADAGVPGRVLTYPGQPHSFVGTMEEIRAGGPQADAWDELVRFLDDALRRMEETDPVSARETESPRGAGIRYYLTLAWAHAFGRHA